MKQITWKEFKEAVDQRLKEIGAEETVEIEYIDISWRDQGDPVNLSVSKETGLLAIY